MATVRTRVKDADYMKVGNAYEFMGTGFTQLDDEPAASMKSKRYINMVSEVQSVSGYAWSAPFTLDMIESEKAIALIAKIGKQELTGSDTEVDYVKVDLSGTPDSSQTSKGYPARHRTVAIEVASFDDSDGEIEGSGNLHAKSDWDYGWFNTTTKTFTADADAAANFVYAATLAAPSV